MSKGNLFLGQGRGSVGDVVFYRANGQQLARSRNRSPRNPKSDAQLYQRAIAATIAQAYKAGKVIFDHAFEGRQVPAGNQRRFISVNMRKLRAAIDTFLTGGVSTSDTRVVSPGAVSPVPNSYTIAEGSLIQNLFSVSVPSGGVLTAALAEANTGEKLGEYCTRMQLKAGEIFTVVAFGSRVFDEDDLVSQPSEFAFCRLMVKESALTSATAMTAATYGDLFTIDTAGRAIAESQLLSIGIGIDLICISGSVMCGSLGVIRSNENSGLRSNCDMVVDNAAYGVSIGNLLTAWSPETSAVDSPLILEGGGF